MKYLIQFFGERRLNFVDFMSIMLILSIGPFTEGYNWLIILIIGAIGLVISFMVEDALEKQNG